MYGHIRFEEEHLTNDRRPLEPTLPGLRCDDQDLLAELLARRESPDLLAEFPDRDVRLSFADAYSQALADAEMLQERGVRPGVPIVISMDNEPEFIPLWLATLMVRGIAV